MLSQKRLLPYAATVLLVLGLAGFDHAEAAPLQQDAVDSTRKVIHQVIVNDLIDNNMAAIQNFLQSMDPTDIRDVKLPVTPHIFMNLHTGWLQNLALLKRSGRCLLTYTERRMTIDMNFGWDELVFDYRYLIKMLLISREGDFHGQLSKLKIRVAIDVDFENYRITMRRLQFVDTGKITLQLEGHFTDKIYNLIIKAVTWIAKSTVLKTIEQKAMEMIRAEINDFNHAFGKHHRQLIFANLNRYTIPDVEPKNFEFQENLL